MFNDKNNINEKSFPFNLNLANLSVPSTLANNSLSPTSTTNPLTTTITKTENSLNFITKKTSDTELIHNPTFWTVGYNILKGNPKIIPSNGKLIDPGFASDVFNLNFQGKKTGDGLFEYSSGFSLQTTEICQTNFSSQTITT